METTPITIDMTGERLVADATGALYWPREETLIVADLHFEKGSAFARRGIFLPPYDTRETLRLLNNALARHRARRVVALGDSFHDTGGAERIAPQDASILHGLMREREWIWIRGNHDPAPPASLGGETADEIRLGPLTLRHEPRAGHAQGEIAGHLHPCATVAARGRRLRRRCFAFDGARLVLPAFGAFTGGLNVFDPAFALVLRAPFSVMMLGRARVYPVRHTRLVPDAV